MQDHKITVGKTPINAHHFKLFCGYVGIGLLFLDWSLSSAAQAYAYLHPFEPLIGISGKTGAALSAAVFWFERKGI